MGWVGGGRNGRFWGAPILAQNPGKYSIFPQKMQNRGAPKTAIPTTTHPIPHLTPSYFLGGGGGIAQSSRDMSQNGVLHRCACVKLSTKEGYLTFFGGEWLGQDPWETPAGSP